ncbi:MAG TPA: carbamoyl-phosphate synthase large subunit [Candidatus Micrarchaeia archaeon]|nr:carbamoyl-phosphate synthase large subunit [Candidatus Micrarchaeia archaeon]
MAEGALVLESGAVFRGRWFGAPPDQGAEPAHGEVVFNTCMTGYQEVCTDPSYAGQVVVFTYPLIGNVGAAAVDCESGRAHCRAVVVARCSDTAPHWQAESTFADWLRTEGVPGLTEVDTRALTRHLRERGTLRGLVVPGAVDDLAGWVERARRVPTLSEQRLVDGVTCAAPYRADDPLHPALLAGLALGPRGTRPDPPRVAVLDYGVKRGTLRSLVSRGAEVLVLPASSGLADVERVRPDGVVLSNGPGDPAALPEAVALTRRLLDRYPVLAICLGHQLMARAIGATTSRLRFGHHGGNHPVQDLRTGRVFVTAQNHEFQVDGDSLPDGGGWFVAERNLNDGSVEGLRHPGLPVIAVQYHPEGSPGPQDRQELFDEFLAWCRGGRVSAPQPGAAAARTARRPRPPARVLVLGSGPIVIGQAAEFDYAGTQACRALREEGVQVVLVNSNPATIMTDDGVADRVYLEPLTVASVARIIERERPQGLLAGLGGQTALNLAVELDGAGVLERHGVRVLGTPLTAVRDAEDRERFKRRMEQLGEPVPPSRTIRSREEAEAFAADIGLPLVVRPAYTLGGTGGGLARTPAEFSATVLRGLAASPIGQVLVEQALLGWRELEYEVMRDGDDTCLVVCAMENLDPMGVHTGDSIVVAPSQTLTDKEHQQLRSAALRIIRGLGIEGGCNVQFALHPGGHAYHVIEVNPRVSRSSALASKATGYPIARVAAKIAVGRRLHEIENRVTGRTTCAFEPALDYCVVKVPRWPFDKFPDGDRRLGTQMKSTGEVMAIGRTFEAALSKALRSLEQRVPVLDADAFGDAALAVATDWRIFAILEALRSGVGSARVAAATGFAPWFCDRLQKLVAVEAEVARSLAAADPGPAAQGAEPARVLRAAKRAGLSDGRIAELAGRSEDTVRAWRESLGVVTTYKCVDTCAAEFAAATPYFYSSFEDEDEQAAGDGGSAVVLGSGPIRIGQGIEFDCCSVQAAQALRRQGVVTALVNSNPETVSTDFDSSDRLYFEPLDLEAVVEVCRVERPRGIVVQFGGQTAVNLAGPLAARGLPLLGAPVAAIDIAEDRGQFDRLLESLGIPRPSGGATFDVAGALAIARRVGYPVLVRPSYVLGGRAMEVVHDDDDLRRHLGPALAAAGGGRDGDRVAEVLVDKYLLGPEVEVDAICDGVTVVIPAVLEHIERAGVHSGDSMAVVPPQRLPAAVLERIVSITKELALATGTLGLVNIQYVVHRGRVLVLEVNPRASRTVPFLSKVTGVPMVELATRAILGESLAALGWPDGLCPPPRLVAVKAPVFSMRKLDAVDALLGPEMKSTGEAIGIGHAFADALEKACTAAFGPLPVGGGALISIADPDKPELLPVAARLAELGFLCYATANTALALREAGVSVVTVHKLGAGQPNVVDLIEAGQVALVINTISRTATDELGADGATRRRPVRDGYRIRQAAVQRGIPCLTSLDTAAALVEAIARHVQGRPIEVGTLAAYRDGPAAVAGAPVGGAPWLWPDRPA